MEPCSIQQAALWSLRDFLTAQFDADDRFAPTVPLRRVVVLGEWPGSGQTLPPRAITIIPAGERRDLHLTAEVVKKAVPVNNLGDFTWSIKGINQPFQLDIWAANDFDRDLMCDALDRFLNMGPYYTLGAGDFTRDGVLLQLDPVSGHEGFLDFTFEGPKAVNEEDANGEYQYRALVRGEVDAELTFTATTAHLVRVKLQQTLDGNPLNFNLTKNAVGDGFNIASAP